MRPDDLDTDDIRQGSTTRHMTRVLVISTIAALVILFGIWAYLG